MKEEIVPSSEEILVAFSLSNIPDIITQEEFDDVKKAIKEELKEKGELKKQLDYLGSGEYINQLKWERDMLENLIDSEELSSKAYSIKKLMRANTTLAQCLEEKKKIINKTIDKLYCWGETLDPDFQKEMLDILEVKDDRNRTITNGKR